MYYRETKKQFGRSCQPCLFNATNYLQHNVVTLRDLKRQFVGELHGAYQLKKTPSLCSSDTNFWPTGLRALFEPSAAQSPSLSSFHEPHFPSVPFYVSSASALMTKAMMLPSYCSTSATVLSIFGPPCRFGFMSLSRRHFSSLSIPSTYPSGSTPTGPSVFYP